MFRKFIEFSMYSQRCIIAGTLVACSVSVLIPVRPPVWSPAPLLTLKRTGWGPGRQVPYAYSRIHEFALHVHMPWATRHHGAIPVTKHWACVTLPDCMESGNCTLQCRCHTLEK